MVQCARVVLLLWHNRKIGCARRGCVCVCVRACCYCCLAGLAVVFVYLLGRYYYDRFVYFRGLE